MYFERKQKNWPAASQRKPLFHKRHLPKRSWQKRTRLKLIFLEEDCSFFSLRYYSWEVGKKRRKLTFVGSTRCLAQSLHRPLLPSEVHYLLKVWAVFQFRWHCRLHFLNRIRESLFPWDWQAESQRERPEFSFFQVRLEFLLIEAFTQKSNA